MLCRPSLVELVYDFSHSSTNRAAEGLGLPILASVPCSSVKTYPKESRTPDKLEGSENDKPPLLASYQKAAIFVLVSFLLMAAAVKTK